MGRTALATCRAFWNSGSEICRHLCAGLDFPSRWGSFPIMDAGGSPFPHGGSVDPVGMDSTIPIGRGKSGPSFPNFVCPINGRTCPGPTSMGVVLGNGIIPLEGSLGAACSCLRHFLEPLLSIHSSVSESNSDSHLCHSHDTGEALHFPNVLTSFWWLLSSVPSLDCLVSALQRWSFSEESFSSRAFMLFLLPCIGLDTRRACRGPHPLHHLLCGS